MSTQILSYPKTSNRRLRKPLAMLAAFAISFGGGLFVNVVSAPEAAAVPPHQIGNFWENWAGGWYASCKQVAQPLLIDRQSLYAGNDARNWGYVVQNNQPVTGPVSWLGNATNCPGVGPNPGSGTTWASTIAVDVDSNGARGAKYGYAWWWGTTSSTVVAALQTNGVTVPGNIVNNQMTPLFRIPDGGTAAQFTPIPIASYFGTTAGGVARYWSGGEVVQKTGEIMFTGAEGVAMNSFEILLFDPNTGHYNYSGKLTPMSPADNIFGTANTASPGAGYVASDMALDFDGNAYLLVVSNQAVPAFGLSAATRTWLVKVVPSEVADWTYELVMPLTGGPGQGSVPIGSSNVNMWGMSFYNGWLYAVATGGAYLVRINPMSGQVFNIPSGTTSLNIATTQDLASGQTARVIAGTVYNDANANGIIESSEGGLPGQKVALYQNSSGTWVYQGVRTTNAQGNYSFLLGGDGDFIVRLVNPVISGVNAWQTYASGGGELNPVVARCANGNITSGGAKCYGAMMAPAIDKALPAAANAPGNDTSMQPSAMPMYSSVSISTDEEVAHADFGVAVSASYGDAAAGPSSVSGGAPVHNNAGLPELWLGEKLGTGAGPFTNDTANNETDDGVTIDSASGPIALGGTVLAATKQYQLTGDVSYRLSPPADPGFVTGWTTGAGNNTWNNTAKWTPVISAGKASGPFQFQSTGVVAGTPAVQFRASASMSQQTLPDNSGYEYQGNGVVAKPWTTPGEIEDYRFYVADAVYRPAAVTNGGSDTFTVAGTSISGSATMVVGQAAGASAGSALNLSAKVPNTSWTISGVKVIDTLTGAVLGQPALTWAGDTASFSYTPEQGSDVIVLASYQRYPDVTKSMLSLDHDTVGVDEFITATATIVDADSVPLADVTVSFANASTPATTLSASTCITDGDGTCSVTITSGIAATYGDELAATVMLSGVATPVSGSPATVTFVLGDFSAAHSSFTVTPVANLSNKSTWATADGTSSYAGVLAARDDKGHALPDLDLSDIQFAASSSDVAITAVQNNHDGTYSVLYTSTKADAAPVASVSYLGAKTGADLPIPFATGGPVVDGFECGPGQVGSNVSVAPVSLPVGDASTVTVLVTDKYCNPVPGVTVTVGASGDASVTSGAGYVTDADGIVAAFVTDKTAEVVDVDAWIGTTDKIAPSPVAVTFTAGGPVVDGFECGPGLQGTNLSVDPASLLIGETALATVLVTDKYCNPLPGVAVDLSVNGAATLGATSSMTGSDGKLSVDVTDLVAETVGVTAKIAAATVAGSPALVTFLAGEPVVDGFDCGPGQVGSNIAVSPTTLPVGDSSTVTVLVTDKYCNPLAGVAVDLSTTGDASLVSDSAMTDADGLVTTLLTDRTAETVGVSASISAGTIKPSPVAVTFMAGGPVVDGFECGPGQQSTNVSASPVSLSVGSASTVTVLVTDKYCNPLPAVTVTVGVGGDASVTAPMGYVTDAHGIVTALVTDTTIEVVGVDAWVGTTDKIPPSPVFVTFTGGGPAISGFECGPGQQSTNITASPASLPVSGISTATVLVTDKYCNPLPGVTLNLSVTGAATLGAAPWITGSDGKLAVSVTDLVAETVGVTAKVSAGTVPGSPASIEFIDVTPPDAPVVDRPKPGDVANADPLEVAGTAEPGSTVTVEDGDGNVLCTATADPVTGAWSCSATILDDGPATLVVTATDEAGNVSDSTEVTITVDNSLPSTPVVDPTNGTEITGTADPDSTVTVTDSDGNPVDGCENVRPDATGHFQCRPTNPLPPGSEITITATDDAGNISAPVVVTVQALDIKIKYPLRENLQSETVIGLHFNPGESVHLVVQSTPLDVGYMVADDTGTVSFTFVVPSDFEPGVHTAILTGVVSGEISATFNVRQHVDANTGGSIAPLSPVGAILICLLGAGLLVAAARQKVQRRRSFAQGG